MSLIENLQWRHAVKAFDPNQSVSQENIDKIIEATRLAPTSSLQKLPSTCPFPALFA